MDGVDHVRLSAAVDSLSVLPSVPFSLGSKRHPKDRQTHSLKDAKRNWVKEEGGSFVRFFSWRPRRSNDIEARNFSEGSKAKVLSYPTRAGRRAQGAGSGCNFPPS